MEGEIHWIRQVLSFVSSRPCPATSWWQFKSGEASLSRELALVAVPVSEACCWVGRWKGGECNQGPNEMGNIWAGKKKGFGRDPDCYVLFPYLNWCHVWPKLNSGASWVQFPTKYLKPSWISVQLKSWHSCWGHYPLHGQSVAIRWEQTHRWQPIYSLQNKSVPCRDVREGRGSLLCAWFPAEELGKGRQQLYVSFFFHQEPHSGHVKRCHGGTSPSQCNVPSLVRQSGAKLVVRCPEATKMPIWNKSRWLNHDRQNRAIKLPCILIYRP